MSEDHQAQQLSECFGDKSIYEIFEIAKDADEETVKKAYRRLALRYHPDKGGDAKMFQAISLAHSILADPQKRKIYDETGDVDAEETSQDFDFWYEYFRGLFPKISVNDIDKFSKEYIGSSEERSDVIKAYNTHGGDLVKIMDCIMLAEAGDEHRICSVIDDAIQTGELKTCKKYAATKVSAQVSDKRKRKKDEKVGGAESLEQLILARNSQRSSSTSSAMQQIFEKYDGENGKKKSGSKKTKTDVYDIPDSEFEALQKKLVNKTATK